MKTLKTACFVIFTSLGLMSCSTSQNFNSKKASSEKINQTLNNTSWVLKRIDAQKRDFIATKEQKELVLNFKDNFYNYDDGCNGNGGEFTISDKKIVFAPGMSTLRYCGEEMKHLIYRVPIIETKSIKIQNNELQLLNNEDVVIATYIKKDAE